ncbi:hypothetical protein ABBQ32_003809 [Trebouxia sp. C0010 RCD-2024]
MADGRPKRETAPPGRFQGFYTTITGLVTPSKPAASRSQRVSERAEGSDYDSQPEILKSSQPPQLLPAPASPRPSPSSATDFRGMLDEVMSVNQLHNQRMFGELQSELKSELRSSNTQVMDEFRADVRQFCAELQQTFRTEMGQEVERKVSERIAPLQEELAAVKVEMQQLKERVESSHSSSEG